MKKYFVGIMSGTSADGADAALVEFDDLATQPKTLSFTSVAFNDGLRQQLIALNQATANEIHSAALVANHLAQIYATVATQCIHEAGLKSEQVSAIGCHGQTIRHRPELGFTIQMNNGSALAEAAGIDVVCDFRSADIARGGQGAPIAPAFHQWAFGHASEERAVINIGGISNVTALSPGKPPIGFDSGPGNAMMDLLMVRHFDQAYDRDGIVASQGAVNADLLVSLQDEAFFAKPPPKSTGRDWLNETWLDAKLRTHSAVSTLDQVTTLNEFTAWSIADAIKRFTPNVQRAFVCGGGAYNSFLLQRIRALSGIEVLTTDALGVPAQQVEAVAFAWLAKLCVERTPLDLRTITGAKTAGILGCIYPTLR